MYKVSLEQSKIEEYEVISLEDEKSGCKKYIHSRYAPMKEAIKWAELMYEPEKELYIIFGMGLGYHIRCLLEKVGKETIIVVIEPKVESLYFALEQTQNLSDLKKDKRIYQIFFSEKQELYKRLNNFLANHYSSYLKFGSLSYYENIFSNQYYDFVETVNRVLVHHRSCLDTKDGFSIENVENMLKNAVYMDDGLFPVHFANKFKGMDAILVSAGPSLEKNIDLLRGREEEFIIITGGRTLKPLLDKGIKPHFVVTVDASYENFLLFKDVCDCEVPLVTAWVTHYEIIKNYKGPKIFMDSGESPGLAERLYGESVHQLYASGTVATMQLDFARWIGCEKAAFIGQDLSCTDGKEHAESAAHGSQNRSDISAQTIKVKGNVQEFVYTNTLFNVYKNTMEWLVFEIKPWIEVFNCTEGGVYIEGTTVEPLSEFLRVNCKEKRDISGEIRKIIQETKRQGNPEHIQREFLNMLRLSEQMVKISRNILTILQEYFRKGEMTKENQQKLLNWEKKIRKGRTNLQVAEQFSFKLFREIDSIRIAELLSEKEREEKEYQVKRALYSTINGTYGAFSLIMKKVIEELDQYLRNKTVQY